MPRLSPTDRDRARWRVRFITMATAAGAAALTIGGAGAAAGTFGGRTVAADQPNQSAPTADPNAPLQQPLQPPAGGYNNGGYAQPVVSGGS